MADFALGAANWRHRPDNVGWRPTDAATWRSGRNIRFVFNLGLFPSLYRNMTWSRKPEVHNISHCRQSKTQARPQVTFYSEIWACGFWDRTADRQTDKQKDIQTRWPQYFHPYGGEVTKLHNSVEFTDRNSSWTACIAVTSYTIDRPRLLKLYLLTS